jgi:hypothetical protein
MKKQLNTLNPGDKFYFADNTHLPCMVTEKTNRIFCYIGLTNSEGDHMIKINKERRFKLIDMTPCIGHEVTILNDVEFTIAANIDGEWRVFRKEGLNDVWIDSRVIADHLTRQQASLLASKLNDRGDIWRNDCEIWTKEDSKLDREIRSSGLLKYIIRNFHCIYFPYSVKFTFISLSAAVPHQQSKI